jgi:hypothetical protein
MKQLNINPLHPLYNELITEGINQGYTVVCSQRPLNGLKTWEYETIRHGRWYSYGSIEQYKDIWEYLDAAIINITTNEDIEKIVKMECEKEGIELNEILNDFTMSELAEQFNLYYAEGVNE